MRNRNYRKIAITDDMLKEIEKTNPQLALKIKIAQKSNKRVCYKNVLLARHPKTRNGKVLSQRLVKDISFPDVCYTYDGDGIIFRHPVKKGVRRYGK